MHARSPGGATHSHRSQGIIEERNYKAFFTIQLPQINKELNATLLGAKCRKACGPKAKSAASSAAFLNMTNPLSLSTKQLMFQVLTKETVGDTTQSREFFIEHGKKKKKKMTNAMYTYRVNPLTAAKSLKDKISHAPYMSIYPQ